MAAPGVAAKEAAQGEAPAFPGAVLFYSFESVGAAGGDVAAFGAEKWRDEGLVEADEVY